MIVIVFASVLVDVVCYMDLVVCHSYCCPIGMIVVDVGRVCICLVFDVVRVRVILSLILFVCVFKV